MGNASSGICVLSPFGCFGAITSGVGSLAGGCSLTCARMAGDGPVGGGAGNPLKAGCTGVCMAEPNDCCGGAIGSAIPEVGP